MPIALDFSMLPTGEFFNARSLYRTLQPELTRRLSSLPATLDRARSAVMFAEAAWQKEDAWVAAAYLRAALADYCSMSEVLKLDLSLPQSHRFPVSRNPLLHLLSLIRNLNIHVKSSRAQHQSVPVTWGDQGFDLDVYIIAELSVGDLFDLNNGKHYALSDLDRVVNWFSHAQPHWGAGYLIRVGVEAQATELCGLCGR